MEQTKAWWQEDLSALTKAILKMDSDASSYIWSKIITEAHQRGREQGLREARERIERDLNNWCEIQKKIWESDGSYSYRTGIFNGYACLQDHIPHLISGVECRCPGHDSLLYQQEGK